ncbi:28S ribosomal protein S26, mitochondrial-like [Vombatus ursinus]|uniref:28S ribosomal protein S26, mitochondrial-like n=1 Tax=Vombatus ursinus TaxID=29139 RepID=UPI000FFCF7E9|nr:28S ribosomal protein S26, mitochondrial-like [Vombatus ursinus]
MLGTLGRLGRSVRPLVLAPSLPLLLPSTLSRKSRHDPPSKSKIWRLRTPTPVDPAEMDMLMEHYKSYKQTAQALRLEFMEEVWRKAHEKKFGGLKTVQDFEEHKQLLARNQVENARFPALRISRLQQQEQEWLGELEEMQKAQEMEAFVQEKEKEVLQLQEDGKTLLRIP